MRTSAGSRRAAAENLVDRAGGYYETSAESHGGYLAAVHEVVGESSRDAEELACLLDGDRQRLLLILGVHDR